MTVSYIRPVVPDSTPGKVSETAVRAAAQPLPLIAVPASRPLRLTNVVYRIAAVDHRRRVADRHITAALDWNAGTRLSIRQHNGLLVAAADPHGLFTPTKQGYLRLPADARRLAGVAVGDRVLLTAHVDRQVVTVFPPTALDALLLPALPGGEDV